MNKIKRLTTYLEVVRNNVQSSTGELKEFWLREIRKTEVKIAGLK